MATFAVAVVGKDRPGIIADVTGALAAHGGNLEDSSMSLLHGNFAWTLIVSFDHATLTELDATLDPLRVPGLGLAVYPVAEPGSTASGEVEALQLTVHGGDRPGIVSALTRVIADHGGNITDLSTRLAGGLYAVVAEFDLPVDVDLEQFGQQLRTAADAMGVTAHLAPADSDVL